MKRLDIVAAGSWAVFDHLFEVERLPNQGDTVHILTPVFEVDKVYWGGCSYNAAITAAKLGMRAGLLTVEGEDFETKGYKAYLRSQSVDLSGVIVLEGEQSGHGILIADPQGNSFVFGTLGSALRQKECEPDRHIIQSARAVILAPTFDEFTLTAGRIGKESGVLVAVNGALSLWPVYAEAFIRTTDILFSNHFEIQSLVRLLRIGDEYDLFDLGPRALFITKGKEGGRLVMPEREINIPVVTAERFVDPTGAGDAFAGATITGILLGLSYEIAARIGATVASFVVERKGSQTNLPDWQRMRKRYEAFFEEPLQQ
jgi:sugar/nucleoside kinase (ribokinase family)